MIKYYGLFIIAFFSGRILGNGLVQGKLRLVNRNFPLFVI